MSCETVDIDGDQRKKLEVLHARPGFRIRRLHQLAMAVFARDTPELCVTPTQLGILHIVEACPGIDQGSVSKLLLHDRSSTALAIRSLVSRDLMQREVAKDDKRRRLLYLTDEGRSFFGQVSDAIALGEGILDPLDVTERTEFMRMLTKIVAAMGDFDSHGAPFEQQA